MPKNAERRARLKELFFRAIELEEKDRHQFLDETCGADPELRAELDSLLRHHRRSDLPEHFYERKH